MVYGSTYLSFSRFNLDEDENERPSFASMEKPTDSLDKKLAASGFTKKDSEAIEKVQRKIVANMILIEMHIVHLFVKKEDEMVWERDSFHCHTKLLILINHTLA